VRTVIESRRMIYLTLRVEELSLPTMFMLQAYESNAGVDITKNVLLIAIGMLAPLVLLFRGYVLFVKLNLQGRYRVDGETELGLSVLM
jgi:hypothetical protein